MKDFKISVAVSPLGGGGGVQRELELLKVSVLYGDRVTFLGAGSGPHSLFLGLDDLPIEQQIERLVDVGRSHPDQIQRLSDPHQRKFRIHADYVDKMRIARSQRIWTPRHDRAKRLMHEQWLEMQHRYRCDPILGQFLSAKESGIVDYRMIDYKQGFRQQSDAFIDYVANQIRGSEAYPLFDVIAGLLGHHRLKNSGDDIDLATAKILSHMGFVMNSLTRLPSFPSKPMDEVLGIRLDLSRYLGRFRAAMLQYSSAVEVLPWDREFERSADVVFRSTVVPAVAELEEIAQQNNLVDALIRRAHDKPGATVAGLSALAGGLSIALSPASIAHEIVGALLGGGAAAIGAAVTALGLARESSRMEDKMKRNQMYFFYRVSR